MKIVFMGTPDFAVASLDAIVEAGHEVLLVVTQPDREKGRGKKVQFSPVKECALAHGIPVFQPVRIKTEESVAELKKYPADLFVVAAFGQILSKEILDMPRLGCVNVHASLLPKYRGAAPIQWSIIDGEKETGVTLMKMDVGLDTGDMLAKTVVPITDSETGDSLHDKLAAAGAELLARNLPLIEDGSLAGEKQNDDESCYARMLTKDLGVIDFSKSTQELDRLIRGLNSWPSAFTKRCGLTLKIWEAAAVYNTGEGLECGTVFDITKDSFCVKTGDGALKILSLQLEGKKRMDTGSFLRGNQMTDGEVLPS